MSAIAAAVARWTNPDTRPLFKGSLYDPDTGCMCAQGDVLHNEGGYDTETLRNMGQRQADTLVMSLLGISRAHSVLLRYVNDRSDGQPQNVLADPGSVLGEHSAQILRFWLHLDTLKGADWVKVGKARYAAYAYAYAAYAAYAYAYAAYAYAAYAYAAYARYATYEIIGQTRLAAQGKPFVFLPMFGFATPADIA